MTEISIRQASPADTDTLTAIGKETFYETFAESNTAENMRKYLEDNFTQVKLQAELSNPQSLFYIAWDGEQAVGYLKLNTCSAQTELQDENAIEIERIYVKSAYHGKNVGQLLYEKALEVAQAENRSFIWLGVWEENPKAIRFYEKNGFIPFDKHIFKMGNEEQTDIMMKKTLRLQK